MIICLLHRSCNYLQKRVITFYPKKGNNYVTLLKFDNHHFKKMIMYKGQLNSSDMLYMNFFFNICTQKKTNFFWLCLYECVNLVFTVYVRKKVVSFLSSVLTDVFFFQDSIFQRAWIIMTLIKMLKILMTYKLCAITHVDIVVMGIVLKIITLQ